jgi:hypothetical protein
MKTLTSRFALAAVLSIALAACGGNAPKSSQSAKIGPQGGAVSTSSGFTLSVPAGALSQEVEIQVNETEPNDGAAHRFELEPRDVKLNSSVHVSMKLGSDDATMKMVEVDDNDVEHALENEQDDAAEHSRDADMDHMGTIEVRHQHVCSPVCASGLECDDGVCKPHGGK